MDQHTSPGTLLAAAVAAIRVRHYSIRTEQAYCDWIKRYVLFHRKRHPAEMGAREVEAFLSHLAVGRNVAAATQNQAKAALLFLYRNVLGIELEWLGEVRSAKMPSRLPVVLTRDEVAQVLARLRGVHSLVGRLLYGTGMRIMEGVRVRVKDIDFPRHAILIRDGKGFKDRVTVLPNALVPSLHQQLAHARDVHRRDLASGRGDVWLPFALARKYPAAAPRMGLAIRVSRRRDLARIRVTAGGGAIT